MPPVAVVVGFKSFVLRCDLSGNNSRKGDSDILTVPSTATASRIGPLTLPDSLATAMHELPPELIFLILRELKGYKGALEKCSLVCSAWREICIPFLFHDLRLFDSPSRIRAYRLLMFHAPHLRPHVQKLTLLSPSMVMGEADSKSDEERELLLSLIEALPKLNTLHSDVYSWTDDWCLRIPRCSSITALHIWDPYSLTANTPPWLLKLLRETADTLRSLSLGGLFFQQISLEGGVDGRVALPNPMNALEALRIQTCYNLPFHPEVITMPNLQVLECRKHRQMAFCESLPASLKTLVVDTAVGSYPDREGLAEPHTFSSQVDFLSVRKTSVSLGNEWIMHLPYAH